MGGDGQGGRFRFGLMGWLLRMATEGKDHSGFVGSCWFLRCMSVTKVDSWLETWQLESPVALGTCEQLRKLRDAQVGGEPQISSRQDLLTGRRSELRRSYASTSPVTC